MGLDVYYPADIRNALRAAEQAVGAAADAAGDQNDPFAAGFLAGYHAALTTIGLAFGLQLVQVGAPAVRMEGNDVRLLR